MKHLDYHISVILSHVLRIEMKLYNCNSFATAFYFAYNSRISMIGTVVTNVVPILVPVLDVKNA